jgi:hypothetical protein
MSEQQKSAALAIERYKRQSNLPALPDTERYQHRMYVKSETTDQLYIVAQNKKKKHWECECKRWIATRKQCKHLRAMGLPGDMTPFEIESK